MFSFVVQAEDAAFCIPGLVLSFVLGYLRRSVPAAGICCRKNYLPRPRWERCVQLAQDKVDVNNGTNFQIGVSLAGSIGFLKFARCEFSCFLEARSLGVGFCSWMDIAREHTSQ